MPTKPERTRSVHTADGGIVLDVKNGKMFSLNPSASAIFERLEQGCSDEQIVEEMVARFNLPAEAARNDLTNFYTSLRSRSIFPDRSSSSAE